MKKNSHKIKVQEVSSKEEKKGPNKYLVVIFSILAVMAVAFSVYGVAYLSKFYYNWEHPIGDEVVAMMGKIRFINENFPHFNWNHEWDAGQPGFWIYLPFPFFVGALLVRLFSLTYPHAITLLGLISFIFIGVGIYGVTQRLARNRLVSIFAALLAMTSQGIWYWNGAGYYARTFGMSFYFLALWAGIALIQKVEKRGKLFPLPKLEFFLTVILFFLTAYSHAFSNYLILGTLIVLLLVALTTFKRKILANIVVIGTGIGFSAFFYFLMLQANFQFYRNVIFHREYGPHPLRLFWNLKVFEGYAGAPEVSPLILPLVALLLIWLVISRKRFKGFEKVDKKIFWVFFAFFIISLIYPLQGTLYIPKMFYIFLLVCDAPFLVSAFGSIIIGAVLASLLRSLNKVLRYIFPAIMIGLVIWMSFSGALFSLEDKWPRRFKNAEEGWIENIVIDPESKDYRMGTTNPQWAEQFNYFYDVPQNRDYFAQGVVYADWQFWQQACVWDIECDYEQTDFLIDWFSLKWILTTASAVDTSYEKFNAKPENYDLVYQENPNFYEFIPKEISPILAATNTPSVLAVGKEESSFDILVRGSARVNNNSQKLIPVRGKEYIDKYTLEELAQFDIIFLYEYKYRNRSKASELLKQYVENGGGLIVEGMLSPEDLTYDTRELFEPLPASPITQEIRDYDWDFLASNHEINEGIDYSLFSPAVYEEEYGWKIVSTKSYNGYKEVLSSEGSPIILANELGKGRVVWMGVNLNYHITNKNNNEEAKLFGNIVNWVSQNKMEQHKAVDYEAKFIHPERREIEVSSQAESILNKEYYFPAWKAYLEKDGQKINLDIYRGGLDQQYIPLPDNIEAPYKVVMVYGKWPVEIVGYIVSGITLFFLLIYLFLGQRVTRPLGRIFGLKKIRKKTTSWWDKDEDE